MNNDTRIIKTICIIMLFVSFFLLSGLVGGYENGDIITSDFIKYASIIVIVSLISAKGIDLMEQIEDGRK